MKVNTYSEVSSIKSWAEADRPREKLLNHGRMVLSDAELIAILIGSGTQSLSAIDVGKNILTEVQNDLNQLAKFSVKELTKFKGIGEAKAITIISALELGRRRKEAEVIEKPKITSSTDAYNLLKSVLIDLPHEEFWVIFLNRANRVIKLKRISMGGVSGTVADVKIIFKEGIENLASGMILAHNHPSGNLNPSEQDIRLTKKMKESGVILDIPVLDHIIFTEQSYYSFADEAML
ncbi:RadC family protein [Marivirga arenosa]|uniref:DNA repair protein RadC n=1 Tax=Marivirga arenosa TaxID=3059076 RepID=A0AA51N772_9BACT|nr:MULTISPECIES: DNA repair protein RadC [unclassified Marivirga]WMN07412.1 DNA repair protein RadC [Marivirga sp. ABR2-2]WNB18360.1 DNA repair protein RadC [Marivirga sp. BKB1-2]